MDTSCKNLISTFGWIATGPLNKNKKKWPPRFGCAPSADIAGTTLRKVQRKEARVFLILRNPRPSHGLENATN